MNDFIPVERAVQAACSTRSFPPDAVGHGGPAYRLLSAARYAESGAEHPGRRQRLSRCASQLLQENGAKRVRALYVSPAPIACCTRLAAPARRSRGSDVFAVFHDLIGVRPCGFVSRSTQEVLSATLEEAQGEDRHWADYNLDCYTFLAGSHARVCGPAN
jgi:hypothetical protein